MESFDRACRTIRGLGRRVVLPEGDDRRVMQAARRLIDQRLAIPILIGQSDDIAKTARETGVVMTGITVVDPRNAGADPSLYGAVLSKRPTMAPALASRLVTKPLYCGGALVASGRADALVAGVAHPTRRVIEASLLTIGLAADIATPSSFFLMTCPHAVGGQRTLIFADCAVNVDPDADTLADIAVASAISSSALLNDTPRVAFLSFSTHGSAQHARISKVTAALARARRLRPDLAFDGELQADAALSQLVAQKKLASPSSVAGTANVLVFPDLDSANIAYKLTQYLGGATATGPFLQGFAKPVSDLSRGASIDDIVATVVLTLARA